MSFFVGAGASGAGSAWVSEGSSAGASALRSMSMSASMAPSRVSSGWGVGSDFIGGEFESAIVGGGGKERIGCVEDSYEDLWVVLRYSLRSDAALRGSSGIH